ncbi:1-aminocyclopropane-1-carboxylate deaminase/D-cysteine desulfhydrase [Polyangium aurulentum]|uniref:1-aminocyclopropane-1-carboxylate deaminase/D-cysteine desulfhydrase n=1 Tax=Polyangium aurulentum TaxID=2567896 RepID=UPI001F18AFDA|nr:pyridoxal-phosphate dependent enzyme [Polyangium aurulentum]
MRAYPGLAARVPRVPLALLPTPVERASRLGQPGLASLYIKRDDQSGALHGGGKTRKLEFLLAEAQRAGARAVVTFGGAGSNHAVATALYASHVGLHTILMLAAQPGSDHVRENLLAMRRAGAEIRLVPGVAEAEARARRLWARSAPGEAPFVLPAGGTSPLGNLAYINAALELAEQVGAGQMPVPDALYVAMGTMGCVVGLAIGLKLAGLRTKVVAVRASSPETSSEARLFALIDSTVAYARGLDPAFPAVRLSRSDVEIAGAYLGRGYAQPTAAGLSAIALARETEGLSLEPTYTGKALAALLASAEALRGKVVLFWNTHNGRPLQTDGVDPRSLPSSFWHYFER